MTNLEKYDSSVSKALEAYRKETSDLYEKNIETTSMEDRIKENKIAVLWWKYAYRPTSPDRGPVVRNGEVVCLVRWRYRVKTIEGWTSNYVAVITDGTEVTEGVEGFLNEKELTRRVPTEEASSIDEAMAIALRYARSGR